MIPLTVAEELRQTLLDYLDTTFAFRDDAISTAMERFLTDPENGLFKGPFVHIRLPFERAATGAVDSRSTSVGRSARATFWRGVSGGLVRRSSRICVAWRANS